MIIPDYPFRVEFEVSSSCTLNCSYCYAQPFSGQSPSFEDLVYMFTKTKREADPFEVVLLGGEPFVRKDIVDVVETANVIFDRLIGVSTNGTQIGKLPKEELSRLRQLTDDKRTLLQVSLDSMNPAVNDRVRGRTLETLKGIDALEKHGISFQVGIVLTRINAADALDTVRYLVSNYDCMTRVNLECLLPTLKLGSRYHELALPKEEMFQIHLSTKRIIDSLRRDIDVKGVVDDVRPESEGNALFDSYDCRACSAGLLRAGVFVNGDVGPCLLMRDSVVGNLHEESWKDIWDRSKSRYFGLQGVDSQCFVNLVRTDSAKERMCDKRCTRVA